MKLGIVSAALPQLSLDELAHWSAANGFQMLELMCWPVSRAERRYAGVTHVDVVDFTKEKAAEVNATMAKYDLEISGLGYYPNPLIADLAQREFFLAHLQKVIVAASMLGVPVVNTFIGRDKDKTIEANLDEFAKVWPVVIQFAAEHNVKIAIENCPMIFSHDEWPGGNNLAISPHVWRQMFAIIPAANFGLNFDPSHLIWQMIDVERAVYEFGARIFHVHAKDMRIDREQLYQRGILSAGMGWQIPRLPGLGEVNWSKFFSALYAVGYDYAVCIEHEDRAFEQTEELVKRGFLIARDVLQPYIH
ncbi:MAG TPA: sugar phosphate isomerase/epimerase [Blastocatellia bacterium]|nr:sugar phosphate isomerase/epimerase [Blastocatellia bacterium]